MHVGHALNPAAGSGGAAYTAAQRNGDAGRLALKRADQEFAALQEIEAGPIDVVQAVEQQCGQVRCVGHEIALTGQQGPGLRYQAATVPAPPFEGFAHCVIPGHPA
jgi:hypothetical protein